MAFIFDTSKGETPESIKRKRDLVRALMGAQRTPQNVGEGLSALGDGIVANILASRADKAEKAGLAGADADWSTLNPSTEFPPAPDSPVAAPVGPDPASPAGGARAAAGGPPELRSGITATAEALGIDPVDLATAISYETGGTFDPTKRGPTTQWGQHRGLIQFGEPQAKQYGVNWDDPLGSQLGPQGAIANYLRDTGVKPGMGLLDIYSAINAGGVGRYGASDASNGGAPGTVRDKVEQQMGGHRAKALAMFGGASGQPPAAQAVNALAEGAPAQVASLDPSIGIPSPVADPAAAMVPGSPASVTPAGQRVIRALVDKRPMADTVPQPAQQAAGPVVADASAPAAAPAQPRNVPVMAGGDAPPLRSSSPTLQALLKAASNPFMSEGRRAIINSLVQQEMKRQDPAYQIELRKNQIDAEKAQLELDLLRNPRMSPYEREQIRLRQEELDQKKRGLLELSPGTTVFDPQDRTPVYTAPDKANAPTVQTFYDEQGREYKAQWNSQTQKWDPVGGSKASANGIEVVGPDGTTMRIGGGGKLTEGQSKDIVYYTQGADADEALQKLDKFLPDWSQENAGKLPLGIGNYLREPAFRQAKNAGELFLTAILRKQTGAAVTKEEWERYGPMFLPVPGDDPDTMQMKRRAREVGLQAIKSGLGTAEAVANANRALLGLPDRALTPQPDFPNGTEGSKGSTGKTSGGLEWRVEP